ncbi:MAG TPA: hypothetical protein VFQ60_03445 [Patescibacteria group bacterium]|nr:hypothetical protein [Patescibacteria group bacterium]
MWFWIFGLIFLIILIAVVFRSVLSVIMEQGDHFLLVVAVILLLFTVTAGILIQTIPTPGPSAVSNFKIYLK